MYSVYLDGKILHDVRLKEDGLVIYSPTLEEELNKAGSLKFTITPNNPKYDSLKKLSSFVTVYDNDEEIFRGRVLDDTEDFYKRKAVVVEGDLNFLLDSIYRPFSFQGDIPDLFKNIIDNHNSQVEEEKKFEIGHITVSDANNYINRSSIYYKKSLDVINEKIIETHGGYIDTRKENGKYYIDLLADYERINTQTIEFKKNLLDITKYITAENIYTVLIPLGAQVGEETEGEEAEKKRITIESVNNGIDYIYSQTAINLFGKIWNTIEYDDVTEPSNLLKKAENDLNNNIELSITLTLKAVDLHLLDVDVERLRKGDYVRVISVPHGLNTYFQLNKINLKLSNPEQSTYEFGVSYSSLSETTVSRNKTISQTEKTVNESNEKVNQSLNQVENIVVKLDEDFVSTRTFEQFKDSLGTASKAGISTVLTNSNSGYVLDARVGRTILNMFNEIEEKIPTKTSELDNDAMYVKAGDLEAINIPKKISDLEDDISVITQETFNSLQDRVKTLEDKINENKEEGGNSE